MLNLFLSIAGLAGIFLTTWPTAITLSIIKLEPVNDKIYRYRQNDELSK
jgi:hypothetical protein